MSLLILSVVLWVVLIIFAVRYIRRKMRRKYLCSRCRYDELDVCTRPERPRAEECDIYQEIEELDEEDAEEDTDQDLDDFWKSL